MATTWTSASTPKGVEEIAPPAGQDCPASPGRSPVLRAAFVMSWVVVGLMVVISLLGLTVDGLYTDGAWAAQAFRGGDLVTLMLAAPLLAGSLILTMRGSQRAAAAWIGMLGYSVYNYAFYVFGAAFNDAFGLHILVFSVSLFALACGLPSLDVAAIGERLRNDRVARWAAVLLIAVGVAQAVAWLVLLARYVVTGELLEEIPVAGQHLIFALDLSLMVPALVVSGVLLFRRRAAGFLLGTAAATLGAVYAANGMAAAWFQADAGVPGAQAVSPTNVVIAIGMLLPAGLLWTGSRARTAG